MKASKPMDTQKPADADAQAKVEADAKAEAEAEAKALATAAADAKAQAEADGKRQADADANSKAIAEAQAKADARAQPAGWTLARADTIRAKPTVLIKGPAQGRYRIGRMFTAEPVAIMASELSEADMAALLADPELMVLTVNAPH